MRSFYGGLSYEKLKEARKGDIFLVPVMPAPDMEVMCFKDCNTEFEVLYKTNEKILLHANSSICSTIINDVVTDWESTALCRDLEKLSKTFEIKNKCTILSVQEIKKYYNVFSLPFKRSRYFDTTCQYWTRTKSQKPETNWAYAWVSCENEKSGIEFYCGRVNEPKEVVPALWITLKNEDKFSLE